MTTFLMGVMFGFIVGYPLGLWATWYTEKEVRKHVER
jgi:ABC-type dipeptide/oligopeptide/nickel transport system permease component